MLSQKVQAFMLCRYLKIVNTVVSSSPILHQYCSKCFVSTEEQFSVWPFYCVINELSFIERAERQNMIFAGLWYDDSKPYMVTFLKTTKRPHWEQLNQDINRWLHMVCTFFVIPKPEANFTHIQLPKMYLAAHLKMFDREFCPNDTKLWLWTEMNTFFSICIGQFYKMSKLLVLNI